ncbi:cell division protein FtsA [Phaeovibrio sulfidiphilus]|uniref:Cell division protein FtsA n=1 Tax=Phaeovibrio sulfidiphilus TaxID=1220600 RepID=A0A8J6YQM0_9PROT|nr:cell division protein FtsA [Phaeovibrio sulfidiphilus]MBE1237522.1 cell division protein FtsA [Phaeovibrio sulfidiphilus]
MIMMRARDQDRSLSPDPLWPQGQDRWRGRERTVGVLDVGTTKIVCLIARLEPAGPRVIGAGHHRADGVRAGQVSNMDDLEHAVRSCVAVAETMAQTRLENVFVNLSGGNPHSTLVELELDMDGRLVRPSDLAKLQEFGREHVSAPGRDIVHGQNLSYAIDGGSGVLDPVGSYAQTLGATMHLVTFRSGPLRNLSTVIGRCHLGVEGRLLTPFASALACLSDEERAAGATLIDLGGGVTSIAVFADSRPVYAGAVPLGAQHITTDLMQGLNTPFAVAERLKVMYGTCLCSPSDARDRLRIPQMGGESEEVCVDVPRSMLAQIIHPRIEEILEMVRDKLEKPGISSLGTRLVALTGGGSQLQGVRDLAEAILERPVHLRHPIRFRGQAETAFGPAFATANGLLRYAARPTLYTHSDFPETLEETAPPGMFGKLSLWLRENF